jgi:class 3 adenylate cyclase
MEDTAQQNPISVLFLEDDAEDAILVRALLADARDGEFELRHVERIDDLDDALAEGTFGCALLDLSLPGATQLEAVHRVHSVAPDLPIVIFTGLDDEQLAVKALHAGAQDYLIKGGVDGESLARSIRYAIERKRAEGGVTGRVERQHRTVTMLFTNLVGSTELLEHLGDDGAEQVRRTHFRVLRDAVLARDGQEVKNLGDGLMVVFPSALDAVGCAIDMQRAVHLFNSDQGQEKLQVRVGLHVGEPIRREDDYFGTPVVVAKRLCDAAAGGQILVSGLVRGLIGSRGGHKFGRSEALELKGLAEPISAHEVVWAQPAGRERMVLPAALAAPRRTPFVGRQQDFARLSEHWRNVLSGKRQLVFLSGASGIGKTRLAEEFARSVHGHGAVVLYGRSDEQALIPYQPFVEAIDHYVAVCPRAELREKVSGKDHLARLIPNLDPRAPSLPEPIRPMSPEDRHLLFAAVASLIDLIAESGPLLLVLEDLHWADQPTLLLLRHVARHPASSPVLIIGTYRETERIRGDLLSRTLVDLRRDRLFERIDLQGLDPESVRVLVNAWSNHETDHELAHSLHDRTQGNPFFIEELLRSLSDAGTIDAEGARWETDRAIERIGVPGGVKDAIAHHLSRLSPVANRLLRISAVIGLEFELEVLGRVSALPEDRLLDAVEEALVAGLIEEATAGRARYSFSHALVRETLYTSTRRMERVRLHGAIGEALELSYGDVPERFIELAHHYAEAPRGYARKAVHYATLAGHHAMCVFAYEQAAQLFELALRVGTLMESDVEQRAELTLALGQAQARADDKAARDNLITAADAARACGRQDVLAQAALAIHVFNASPGVTDMTAVELLEEALERIDSEDPALRARLLVRLAVALYYLGGTSERREALVEEAVSVARDLDDRETLAYVLSNGQLATWGPDTTERDLAWVRELLEIGVGPAGAELALHTRMRQVDYLLELDDLPAADAAIEALESMAKTNPEPRARAYVPLQLARRASIEGRFAEAEALNAEAAHAAGTLEDQMLALLSAAQRAMLRWLQGRMDEAEEVMRRFAEQSPGMPAWQAGLLVVECELGHDAEARLGLERLSQRGFTNLPRYNGWLVMVALLADACTRLGDRKAAPELYRLLLPFAGRNVVAPYTIFAGPVARYLGMLASTAGDWDVASRHFEAANRAAARINARPFLALLALDEAAMRMSRGDRDDGNRVLALIDAAAGTARELELWRIVERADQQRSGAIASPMAGARNL